MHISYRARFLMLLIWAICLLPAPTTYAQPEHPHRLDTRGAPASLRFRHLTTDDGLPHNRIEAMLQDRRGFMWFGTSDGLARYDGYRLITYKYDPHNPRSLSNNIVTALLEDQAGMIWVGTREGGLNRLDPDTLSFTRYRPDRNDPGSLGGNEISALANDQAGNLWVGAGGQLNRFDATTQKFARYPLAPCGINSPIKKIVASAEGALWVAAGGLQKFEPDTGAAACYFPARRAMTIDPVNALRS